MRNGSLKSRRIFDPALLARYKALPPAAQVSVRELVKQKLIARFPGADAGMAAQRLDMEAADGLKYRSQPTDDEVRTRS